MEEEGVKLITLAMDLRVTRLLEVFGIILVGLLFGKLSVKGVSFGNSGVLIVATIAGYFLDLKSEYEYQILGIVLFMWAVGLEAGPSFFRAFVQHGKYFIVMVLFLLGISGLTVVTLSTLFQLDPSAALGLFAGAFSSSPAFVAAMEYAPNRDMVILGYGLAYPFGMIAVILFIQIAVNVYRDQIEKLSEGHSNLHLGVYVLENEEFDRVILKETSIFRDHHVLISAILRDNQLFPAGPKTVLLQGDLLRLEGQKEDVELVGSTLGTTVDQDFSAYDDMDTRSIVVENTDNINRTIRDLNLRMTYHVTLTRVIRNGFEFPATPDVSLHYGDIVEAVGSPGNLNQVQAFLGNKFKTVQRRVDITSLAAMLTFAFLIGGLVIPAPFISSFSIGMTGGALITGLLFGHFGKIGNFIGRFPVEATSVMKEFGLALFFVDVGIQTGISFRTTPIDGSDLLVYIIYSILVALIPMLFSFLFGVKFMKLSPSQSFGVICGGMTFTPGLDIIRQADPSEKPVVAYSSVYPVSLIVIIVVVQVSELILRGLL